IPAMPAYAPQAQVSAAKQRLYFYPTILKLRGRKLMVGCIVVVASRPRVVLSGRRAAILKSCAKVLRPLRILVRSRESAKAANTTGCLSQAAEGKEVRMNPGREAGGGRFRVRGVAHL